MFCTSPPRSPKFDFYWPSMILINNLQDRPSASKLIRLMKLSSYPCKPLNQLKESCKKGFVFLFLFYLRRSRAGLGLLRDVLLLLLLVMLVDIFALLSRRPPTKIFIQTKLLVLVRKLRNIGVQLIHVVFVYHSYVLNTVDGYEK